MPLFLSTFDEYIRRRIMLRRGELDVEIEHKLSHTSNELQVVDFVAWSINRKFNSEDDYYYKIIQNKIRNRENMELWK
ncbi:MAG: DUF3800 domain-containing protein [Candidatus Aenigmarchaeota archaeon]|nr:DUF3800 domain-containing protein [Candidatus Aenigmarchaeota archaeon]